MSGLIGGLLMLASFVTVVGYVISGSVAVLIAATIMAFIGCALLLRANHGRLP